MPPPAEPRPTAGFEDGFFVQSADGSARLVFGLVAQTDGRFVLDDPSPITNTFTIRKMRPTFSGRVWRYFDFKVMPDFGNGTTLIQDAYFDIRFSPKLRVRSGKDKTPVGYELLQGDAFLLFPERSLVSSLVPNRDVGFQVQGDLSPKVFYAVGVFNGVADGTRSTTDVDTNDGKDLAARVVVQPFRRPAGQPAGPVSGLGFHLGGSIGSQAGAVPAFRTSVLQTYFEYAAGAAAQGRRTRILPAVFYYYRSLGAFAEFAWSRQPISRGGVVSQVANQASEVTASYVLTGEAASDQGVRPRAPFDPARGQWGAVQVLGRYAQLDIDDLVFVRGLAAAGSASSARALSLAVNWYPVAAIKYYATFERTAFTTGAPPARPTEHSFIVRAQLGF